MTKLQKTAADAVVAWCRKQGMLLQGRPRHVYPRAYVVARTAEKCLMVSTPWVDSEPQVKADTKQYPVKSINEFDSTLNTGDWCVVAYVTGPGWGRPVAVKLPED